MRFLEGRKRQMNAKKLIAIALTLILVFSLTACNTGGDKSNNDETQDTPEVAAAPVTVPDEGNAAEDEKDAEEEEEADDSGDPRFVRLLKSGTFYYECKSIWIDKEEWVNSEEDEIARIGFTAFAGSKMCEGDEPLRDLGRGRTIWDYEARKIIQIDDDKKEYEERPMRGDGTTLYDYSELTMHDSGVEEVRGETMEYIDYIVPAGDIWRYYLKNGDVYAWRFFNHKTNESLYILYVSNVLADPPSSCFEIASDYVKL